MGRFRTRVYAARSPHRRIRSVRMAMRTRNRYATRAWRLRRRAVRPPVHVEASPARRLFRALRRYVGDERRVVACRRPPRSECPARHLVRQAGRGAGAPVVAVGANAVGRGVRATPGDRLSRLTELRRTASHGQLWSRNLQLPADCPAEAHRQVAMSGNRRLLEPIRRTPNVMTGAVPDEAAPVGAEGPLELCPFQRKRPNSSG